MSSTPGSGPSGTEPHPARATPLWPGSLPVGPSAPDDRGHLGADHCEPTGEPAPTEAVSAGAGDGWPGSAQDHSRWPLTGPTPTRTDWPITSPTPTRGSPASPPGSGSTVSAPDPSDWITGDSTWMVGDDSTSAPPPPHTEPTLAGPGPDDMDEVDLSHPLPASGAPWPAPPRTALALDQISLPSFAPFATGLALALTIVLLAVGAALNVNRFGINLAALGGKGPASSRDVVRAYLEAIGAADADKARSYLDSQPVNDLLLNDVVLQRSADQGRLTVISIGTPVTALDGGEQVEASYQVGDTPITSTFHLTYRNGSWRLSEDPGTLGVASLRPAGAKLIVNGKEIPPGFDTLVAFPGRYRIYTTNPYLTFEGGEPVLLVRGPSAAPLVGAIRLVVTEEGIAQARRLTQEAITRCVQQRDLAPPGCPQSIQANANQPVIPETIRWSLEPSNPPSLTVRPVPRSSLVEVVHTGQWRVQTQVMANGRPEKVSSNPVTTTSTWVVELTRRPLEVRLAS